uniref:Uncharacterized protein n=1 Tax=Noctiluca scintillans TaxID=2966 RepID=A0A7S1AHL0_NOCSC|mmetsp:Transcript_45044/g.119461  ORF Transcript_45044/g.119461 Transcript_45044/m.119461 type:complete len:171 (+) Transcript_45044:68-580(+)
MSLPIATEEPLPHEQQNNLLSGGARRRAHAPSPRGEASSGVTAPRCRKSRFEARCRSAAVPPPLPQQTDVKRPLSVDFTGFIERGLAAGSAARTTSTTNSSLARDEEASSDASKADRRNNNRLAGDARWHRGLRAPVFHSPLNANGVRGARGVERPDYRRSGREHQLPRR